MALHLFIGGKADGELVDVPADKNFFNIGEPTGRYFDVEQYRRRRIDTRNGPVDVFTHGVPCPIEALIERYKEEVQ